MKVYIKIGSVSDVITNSSSEVFALNIGDITKDIKKDILKYHKEHTWNGDDLDKLPYDVREILGGDTVIDTIKNMLNGQSGEAGNIDVYTWEDAYKGYCNVYNKQYTPEKWAKLLHINLNDIKKIVIVDVDWAATATINWLQEKYNVILEGDNYYNSEHENAFSYAHYAKDTTGYW